MVRIAELLKQLNEFKGTNIEANSIRWRHRNDGKFYAKKVYDRGMREQQGGCRRPWKQIWKNKTPTKMRCFTWRVARSACLTHERLKRRGLSNNFIVFFYAMKLKKPTTICSSTAKSPHNYGHYSSN